MRRTWYTLLPDFVWIVFVAQGMTLQALLADCGDIMDSTSMLDQMNTYVILSRLKRFDGLLLLRAFSSALFTHVGSAGLACLLKHMRARLRRKLSSASEEHVEEAELCSGMAEEITSTTAALETFLKQEIVAQIRNETLAHVGVLRM